jgi:5-methylthioadenosine/S-adenosylhomocysteine deaminase
MVDGQWLMRDSKVRTMDEGAILREAQEVATRAWRKLFESRSDLARPAGLHLGL